MKHIFVYLLMLIVLLQSISAETIESPLGIGFTSTCYQGQGGTLSFVRDTDTISGFVSQKCYGSFKEDFKKNKNNCLNFLTQNVVTYTNPGYALDCGGSDEKCTTCSTIWQDCLDQEESKINNQVILLQYGQSPCDYTPNKLSCELCESGSAKGTAQTIFNFAYKMYQKNFGFFFLWILPPILYHLLLGLFYLFKKKFLGPKWLFVISFFPSAINSLQMFSLSYPFGGLIPIFFIPFLFVIYFVVLGINYTRTGKIIGPLWAFITTVIIFDIIMILFMLFEAIAFMSH